MFDAHLDGGYKVKESEAHAKMREQFNDKNADAPFSKRLVLTQTQIKSWFSTEKARRTAAGKRLVAKWQHRWMCQTRRRQMKRQVDRDRR